MPSINDFIIGAIASVYVGDYGSPAVLTEVPAPRTQGGRFRYARPEQWERVSQNFRQTGFCEVEMTLRFFFSEDAHKIAMTNSLSAAIDAAPSGQQYTVLLLSPEPDSRSSILIPRCSAQTLVENNFDKTEVTTLPITFGYRERNKSVQIYRRGTYDELDVILGARSPI